MIVGISILTLVLTWICVRSLQEKLCFETYAKSTLGERIDLLYKEKKIRDTLPAIVYDGDKEYKCNISRDCDTNQWIISYTYEGEIMITSENRWLDAVIYNINLKMCQLGWVM